MLVFDPSQTFRTAKAVILPVRVTDACLVFIYPTGPQMGARYVLKETAVIGRTDDCQVRNTDASVSRAHARLDCRDDGYYVTDLGSTNGTFVNNTPVTEALLRDGDYLRIGNCIYRFLEGGNIEAEYHEEIYRLTVQDGLTGLHNRRSLTEFLDRELSRAERHNRPLSLAIFDIDRFKAINDTHGHLAGDTILRQLAAILRPVVRKDELLARYGGEEFVMVLPETTGENAVKACERLRQIVSEHRFEYDGKPVPVTVSIGVAVNGPTADTPERLLRAADAKLYQAKAAGRNRVSF
ncbi:MAG: diguanylate cyclase [Fimbriiglobus sp.]|jgi:diguanylate cyclase (GGDEF)-like protein|nr:diguanylate cyclase [Fimbriiglobus sp.]